MVIAVPDHSHKKVLLDALAAGKHAYIEKPLTHKLEEGDEMVRAVEKSGKVVQVGSQTVSAGCAEKAREMIRGGRLGKITMIEARMYRYSSLSACYYPIPPDATPENVDWQRFLGNAPKRDFDPKRFFQWRLFWDYSGGLTTDLFVHLVSITHYLMDVQEPESVTGFSDIYHWKNYREVPDQITALVSYPQGFVLKLSTTVNFGHPEPMLMVYGTEGTLEYDGSSMKYTYQPPQESFGYATNSWPVKTVEQFKQILNLTEKQQPQSALKARAVEAMTFEADKGHSADIAHLQNFYDGVRTGSGLIEDIRFGANAVRVGHLVNLACKTGQVVHWNSKEHKLDT